VITQRGRAKLQACGEAICLPLVVMNLYQKQRLLVHMLTKHSCAWEGVKRMLEKQMKERQEWVSASRRERPGSALMHAPAGRSLSLYESTHSCQGSILSASLAPRSWYEQAFQHPDRASSSQGCLMSLSALFPSTWRSRFLSPLHVISRKGKKRGKLSFFAPS